MARFLTSKIEIKNRIDRVKNGADVKNEPDEVNDPES